MKPWAYYNEHDKFAAAWLRELIADNLIAPGEVDERSIEDVTPDDLRPFRQCHFFAGIGVWSLAARRSGWDDDAPLWSGSCPCQPFSAAGKGGGFADERHLWPAFHYLIEQCRPSLVVGEQVAGADGDAWFDLVSADLDATGYAFGAAETCAAGFGAPHIRTRNYWVAVAGSAPEWRITGEFSAPERPIRGRRDHGHRIVRDAGRIADAFNDGQRQHGNSVGGTARAGEGGLSGGAQRLRADPADGGAVDGVAVAHNAERWTVGPGGHVGDRTAAGREEGAGDAEGRGGVVGLADAASERWVGRGSSETGHEPGSVERSERLRDATARSGRPGPVNGLWRDADWLRCRDEKWRPVEPGTFPLVDAGTFRNRVGLLRGAGNAITLGQAEGFMRAVAGAL